MGAVGKNFGKRDTSIMFLISSTTPKYCDRVPSIIRMQRPWSPQRDSLIIVFASYNADDWWRCCEMLSLTRGAL